MAQPTIDQKCQILSKVPLFEKLSPQDVEAIAAVSVSRSVKAREELFHKGDPGTQVFVVASGRFKVVATSDEGDDLMFCVVEPGDIVGEVGLLAERKRTATVTALQASTLISIDRREFHALLQSRPDVAIGLLNVLASRLARVSEFLEDTHFLSLPVRLAKKLCDYVARHGKQRPGSSGQEILIDFRLSQEEWGDLVGTTRESINKQFGQWRKDGVITLEAGNVVVLDFDRLQRLADCVVI